MLRCVDVYAVMPDGSRRLSFTGSVRSLIERHWSGIKKPDHDELHDNLIDNLELEIPMIFPKREQIDTEREVWSRGLFRPTPRTYVAIGRE
jgi:hypothetical protein